MTDEMDVREGATTRPSDSIWTGNFISLCLASLTMLLGVQLLLPTLPLYLIKIGGTQQDVGLVMASYTVGAMLMRAVSGWLSDRYGRKKIMVTGLIMTVAATMLYPAANHVSLVAATRALHGLSFGIAGTAMGAIAADSLPVARMAEGLGYFGLTATLSMGLAPMIGVWLVGRFSYTGLFGALTATAVMTLLLSLPVKSARVHLKASPASFRATLSNFFEKSALVPSAVMFLLSFVNGSLVYFIALYAASLNIGNVGLFFAASSLSMIVSRPLSGRWADRGGSTPVILIGFIVTFVGMTVIALWGTVGGFILAGAFIGFGFGFSIPTLQAIAVRNVPPNRRGAATGTYYAAFDLGFGVGGVVWGAIAQWWGYQTMYLTTLVPMIIAWLIYQRFAKRQAVLKVGVSGG